MLCKNVLLSANQDRDSITIFTVNEKDGKLAYTGKKISCKAPVCLVRLHADTSAFYDIPE